MCALDADRVHECRYVIGEELGRVVALRLVGEPSASQVDRDAPVVLRVFRDLEGVAGLVRRQVWDEEERLTRALDLVVHRDAVGLDRRHPGLLVVSMAVRGWSRPSALAALPAHIVPPSEAGGPARPRISSRSWTIAGRLGSRAGPDSRANADTARDAPSSLPVLPRPAATNLAAGAKFGLVRETIR